MDSYSNKFYDPESRYADLSAEDKVIEPDNQEIEKNKKLSKLSDWWFEGRNACADNRQEQAVDDDFVDGLQWFEEDAQILRERNQQPLVFNEIKPTVEWVVGTEKRTRIDWKVLPRTDDDRESAEIKTKLLKYVSDVNKIEFARSRAFESATKSGVGWIEIGIKNDNEDEPLFVRNELWRNIWIDPLSIEPDISDAKWLCRSKILDLDIAVAMFPQHKQLLINYSEDINSLAAQADEDFYDSQLYYQDSISNVSTGDALNSGQSRRDVVRIVEMWYREPMAVQIFRDSTSEYNGQVYDKNNADMLAEAQAAPNSLHDAVKMQVKLAFFIDGSVLLDDRDSPYNHNRFPFVPVYAYRRSRDNMPYGIVRNSRDPQMDLNKRRSKSMFLISTNRTIMDEGAVEDLDQYEEEVARPDAIIVKKQGKELNIETNIRLAEEHLIMAQQDGEYIRQASGVTGENLGQETNAASGKAITARQNQGTVVTASLFDNARLAFQLTGEIMLSLIEQFYSYEKVVRITGDRGVDEFVTVNQLNTETGEYLNDITASQADFKVSEQDYRESMRVAMFEQMMSMLGQIDGNVALSLLDLVFEFSDLPGKDELVKRIRKINGQIDPDDTDAEQKEADFEAQKQQEQQAQQALEQRQTEAEIRAIEAKASKDEASTDKEKMDSLVTALEAALTALQAPQAAVVADNLLDDVPLKNTGAQAQQQIDETNIAIKAIEDANKQSAISALNLQTQNQEV